MSRALVVSGFPGIGKSQFCNTVREGYSIAGDPSQPDTVSISKIGLRVLDSDSSKFSWTEPGTRNPGFPDNYIQHIKDNLEDVDIILVSSHAVVRDALIAAGIEFYLVFPDINTKEEYLKRYKDRGSDDAFVSLLDKNWRRWIGECLDTGCAPGVKLVALGAGQYLTDWLKHYPMETPEDARKRLIMDQLKADLNHSNGPVEKKDYLCGRCGSEDIRFEVVAQWNFEQQKFEFMVADPQFAICIPCGHLSCLTREIITDERP